MRDHSRHIRMKQEQAVAALLEKAQFQRRAETVPLSEALGRVTAHSCASQLTLPTMPTACMDGIAVRFHDLANADTSTWVLGEDYAWANTGTAFPEGFDTVIAIEQVEFPEAGGVVLKYIPDALGENANPVGSTVREGDRIVGPREYLTPAKVAILGMCGYTQVDVMAKPKVVFIPTGDELVPLGQPLPLGKSYETNGILLESKLKVWGAEPTIAPCLPDDWDLIRAAILKACETADIVCINAGSSKGAKDFNMEILEEIGDVICHETNHGPGRHSSVSVVNGTMVVGLSGPPAGCEITADWYLLPLIDHYLYGEARTSVSVRAWMCKSGNVFETRPQPWLPLAGSTPFGSEETESFFAIRPVRLVQTEAGPYAVPVTKEHSIKMLNNDTADGYITLSPAEFNALEEGAPVEVRMRFPYNLSK